MSERDDMIQRQKYTDQRRSFKHNYIYVFTSSFILTLNSGPENSQLTANVLTTFTNIIINKLYKRWDKTFLHCLWNILIPLLISIYVLIMARRCQNINNKHSNNVILWVRIKLEDCCKKHFSNLVLVMLENWTFYCSQNIKNKYSSIFCKKCFSNLQIKLQLGKNNLTF